MIQIPAFRPEWHAVPINNNEVFLLSESRTVVLHGPIYAYLVGLIDGTRTSDDIVDDLHDRASPTEIYFGLLKLERDGYLEDRVNGTPPRRVSAWWSLQGLDPRTTIEQLASTRIAIHQFGDLADLDIPERLSRTDLTIAPNPASGDLHLVIVDDYLRPELASFARETDPSQTPWLVLKPVGLFSWIGPLFDGSDGPCWACLEQRIRVNRDTEQYLQQATGSDQPFPHRAALPSTSGLAIDVAVTELSKYVVTGSRSLRDKLLTFDPFNVNFDRHTVVRRPQCPMCGDPDLIRTSRPIEIGAVKKRSTHDGGYRASSAEESLQVWSHHISPITGVVRSLTRITPEDDLLHVYISGNNMALRSENSRILKRNLRGNTCGKGVSDAQARMSAVGEAIERYSGVFRDEEPVERGTLNSLGERAVDPRTWILYSERQYAERDTWNEIDRRMDAIPRPFDDSIETSWSPVWSLTRQEERLLPTSLLYYSTPADHDSGCFIPESNGSAAGSTLEDALLQGLLELVERDAVAIWWYNRLSQPALDLDTVDEPYVQQLRDSYSSRGRDLWALDLTSDLGIPAFVAVSRRIDGHEFEDIVVAPAAHIDGRIALLRALTELNQMIPGVSPPPGQTSGYTYDDPEAVAWWQTATIENQPWLLPSSALPARKLTDFETPAGEHLRDDIVSIQRLLESRGMEVLVLDQTRPDIGLPVVKAIVPGLRHFWARFAPGRLYDVPVAMNRLVRPTREEDLNPVPVFI